MPTASTIGQWTAGRPKAAHSRSSYLAGLAGEGIGILRNAVVDEPA